MKIKLLALPELFGDCYVTILFLQCFYWRSLQNNREIGQIWNPLNEVQ